MLTLLAQGPAPKTVNRVPAEKKVFSSRRRFSCCSSLDSRKLRQTAVEPCSSSMMNRLWHLAASKLEKKITSCCSVAEVEVVR